MSKETMDDLIIILPGISGSVLTRNGKDVWNLSAGALWSTALSLGKSIRSLILKNDDLSKDLAPDRVKATALIQDAHIVPGLSKIDGYSRLPMELNEAFDLYPCSLDDDQAGNFLEFPYDWRRDNRATAGVLGRVVDRKLELWRKNGGSKNSRVILVAHSMGGLVVQYYLEALEGWPSCRALITFGTPYRGAVQALEYLVNGYKLLLFDLTETMRTFPSVYQLLPRYAVIATAEGVEPIRVTDAAMALNLDSAGVAAHAALHEDLDAAWCRHKNNAQYQKDGYITIPVVGTRQPTSLSADWDGQKLKVGRSLPSNQLGLPADGDGTVPRVSAIPLGQSQAHDFRGYFVAEQHASLQNQEFVLGDLIERIKLLQTDLADVRGALPPSMPGKSLSIEMDDLYTADEPVVIKAEAQDPAPTLEARVAPAGGGAATIVNLQPVSEGQSEATLTGLKPGVYRLELAAAGQDAARYLSVHTIFEIAGREPEG